MSFTNNSAIAGGAVCAYFDAWSGNYHSCLCTGLLLDQWNTISIAKNVDYYINGLNTVLISCTKLQGINVTGSKISDAINFYCNSLPMLVYLSPDIGHCHGCHLT